MAGENSGGTVDLLRQYDAGKLMGEGDAAEGDEQLGSLAGGIGPSVGGTDGEEEALGAVVAEVADAGGEVFGGELLTTTVEQDGEGAYAAGMVVQRLEEGCLCVEDL